MTREPLQCVSSAAGQVVDFNGSFFVCSGSFSGYVSSPALHRVLSQSAEVARCRAVDVVLLKRAITTVEQVSSAVVINIDVVVLCDRSSQWFDSIRVQVNHSEGRFNCGDVSEDIIDDADETQTSELIKCG